MSIDKYNNFNTLTQVAKNNVRVILFVGCSMQVKFCMDSPLIFTKNITGELYKCSLPKDDSGKSIQDFKISVKEAFHKFNIEESTLAIDTLVMNIIGILFHKMPFSKLTYHGLLTTITEKVGYDLGQSFVVKSNTTITLFAPTGKSLFVKDLSTKCLKVADCEKMIELNSEYTDGYITPARLYQDLTNYLL